MHFQLPSLALALSLLSPVLADEPTGSHVARATFFAGSPRATIDLSRRERLFFMSRRQDAAAAPATPAPPPATAPATAAPAAAAPAAGKPGGGKQGGGSILGSAISGIGGLLEDAISAFTGLFGLGGGKTAGAAAGVAGPDKVANVVSTLTNLAEKAYEIYKGSGFGR